MRRPSWSCALALTAWASTEITSYETYAFAPAAPFLTTRTHSSSYSATRDPSILYEEGPVKDDVADGDKGTLQAPVSDLTTRTLYEILQSSPDATRAELKRQYVILCKQTHPDSLIGRSSEEIQVKEAQFREIVSAWRILADKKERQRYDRNLRAKAFTENVERSLENAARNAVPAVGRIIEDLAIPFLRKTANTTMASVNASAEVFFRYRNETSVDIGNAFTSAMNAGRRVVRAIDTYDLMKKCRELEQLAYKDSERAMELRAELAAITDKRLQLALRTPNSAISSIEAFKLLDGLNTIDSITFVQSMMRKHPLAFEITALEEIETEYNEKVGEQKEASDEFCEIQKALREAQKKAEAASEAEIEARRALEEAQRQVIATRQALSDWNKLYANAEAVQKKSAMDVERISLSLERRQEKVRSSLRQKEERLLAERKKKDLVDDGDFTNGGGLTHLEKLRKEERYLEEESARLEDRARRLRSRAAKLRRRVEEIELE